MRISALVFVPLYFTLELRIEIEFATNYIKIYESYISIPPNRYLRYFIYIDGNPIYPRGAY